MPDGWLPVLQSFVAPVTAALVALVVLVWGTRYSANKAAATAVKIARGNQEHALLLDRIKFDRDWRLRQVKGVLDAAEHRIQLVSEFFEAGLQGDWDRQLRTLGTIPQGAESALAALYFGAISGPRLEAVATNWMNCEIMTVQALRDLVGKDPRTYDPNLEVLKALVAATGDLYDEALKYVAQGRT